MPADRTSGGGVARAGSIRSVASTASSTGSVMSYTPYPMPQPGPSNPRHWLKAPAMYDDQLEEGEEAKQIALAAVVGRIMSRAFVERGHYHRAANAKSLGFVRGTLTVSPALAPHLRHGLFVMPGRSYPVAARFSSASPHLQDDRERDERGLGLKVFDVEGPAIGGAGNATTQDLLFSSCPIPEFETIDDALEVFSLREQFWDDPAGLQHALDARGRPPRPLPNVHVASNTMYTQLPMRFGPYVAKLALVPTSPAQLALRAGRPLPPQADATAHRKLLRAYFHAYRATYSLQAQFATTAGGDAADDDEWVPLADVVFGEQETYSDARRVWFEDRVALSPWNGLEDHRPLGAVNRARRAAYELGRRTRAVGNVADVKLVTRIEEMPA